MAVSLYSKSTTRKLWDELLESRKKLSTWCKGNRVNRAEIVLSVQKHFPAEWEDKEHTLGPIPTAICEHCGLEFIMNTARQKFCIPSEGRKRWEINNPQRAKEIREVVLANAKKNPKR